MKDRYKDNTHHDKTIMTPRQKIILGKLISSHMRTGRPIGSKILANIFSLSPAMLRIELKHLVDEGYLETVNEFAGRIPTDQGWEYYAENMSSGKTAEEQLPKQRPRAQKAESEIFDEISEMARRLHIIAISFFRDFQPQLFRSQFTPLFKNPEFSEQQIMRKFFADIEFFEDHIEDAFRLLRREPIQILVGKRNPLLPSGLFASTIAGNERTKWLIGFAGPKRMPYHQSIYFLREISKILNR